MELIHLIYASIAEKNISDSIVEEILASSRKNNYNHQISGMLLFSEGNFFQVLEGEESQINPLMKVIQNDTRHSNVVEIIREPIPKRAFKDWSMGFAEASGTRLDPLEGMNDFFKNGHCLITIDAGRAKKLLQAFSQGFWHQELK